MFPKHIFWYGVPAFVCFIVCVHKMVLWMSHGQGTLAAYLLEEICFDKCFQTGSQALNAAVQNRLEAEIDSFRFVLACC